MIETLKKLNIYIEYEIDFIILLVMIYILHL